jgi:arabinogalactan endo-1,4-beta-galactosidase
MRIKFVVLCAVVAIFFCNLARASTNFLAAADFSFAQYFQSLGVQYLDNGVVTDPFQILKNHGVSLVRLRLFTSSQAQAASDPYNYINNTNYTVPLAVRVKNAGLLFSLDFHYSDTWADPGHQATPSAWTNLNFTQLVAQMRAYNSNTIATFADAGAMPDYVQIGNEITDGMLWPSGQLTGTWSPSNPSWIALGQLMNAAYLGIQDAANATGKPMPKIVIHIDRGGDLATTTNFFVNLEAQGVPFDIIGESYYPFFQGSLSAMSNCVVGAANMFGKPIFIAETAFPWTNTCPTAWLSDLYGYPPSTIGQVSWLVAEGQILRTVPNGLAAGVIYWAGEYQAANGVNEDGYNTASFWNVGGNLLPSLNALVSLASPLMTGPPLALTLAATNTTATNTILNAQAYANGAPSAAYFEWGTTTNYGNLTPANILAANYLGQNVAATITNLTPFTTYHFQEVVTNAAGTNYGGDLTVVTPALVAAGQPASVYQEDFGSVAGAGNDLTLSQVGWFQVGPSSGYSGIYPQAGAVDINTEQSLPDSVAYFGGSSKSGMMYTTNGAGSGTYGDSAFTSINPALYSNLTFSVETQQSFQGSNVSSYFAVQIGTNWYVSTNPMPVNVEGGASANFVMASLVYNPQASGWKKLTIGGSSVTVGSPAGSNLSGSINGIGVVETLTGAGSWDFANLLIDATDPFITSQPTNQSVAPGGNALFSVGATGAPTLVYQWQVNNTNLPGATNSALALVNVQPANAGPYQVMLSNGYGAVTSSVVTLDVTGVPVSFLSGAPGNQLHNGQFQLYLTNLTGQGPVVVDASTNLVNWVPIFTNPSGFGGFGLTDTNAGSYPQRFYRAVTP